MAKLPNSRRAAFTLVELMTVLTIIVILISITIPIVSKVRKSAAQAAVQAEITSIASAIQQYHQTHGAYPGPLGEGQLYQQQMAAGTPSGIAHWDSATNSNIVPDLNNVTASENLVLGLLGGLRPVPGPTGFGFDPGLVGKGARGLNPSNPKSYPSLLDGIPLTHDYTKAPSYGQYIDNAGAANDSNIPEILDRFSSPMPILYLRARVGADGVISINGKDSNNQNVRQDGSGNALPTQYDLNNILPYTAGESGSIGEGKSIRINEYNNANPMPTQGTLPHGLRYLTDTATIEKGTTYQYPYNAFPYFWNKSIPPTNPNAVPGGGPNINMNATGTPRQKDAFILISAGADRVYGTADDITNFGNVTE